MPKKFKINDLNIDCLIAILSKFSLQELIHLRSVCSQWKVAIEKICAGKQSLKLFVGYEAVRYYIEENKELMVEEPDLRLHPIGHQQHDDLVLNSNKLISTTKGIKINQTGSFFLSVLFPNVQKLAVCFENAYYRGYFHDKLNFGPLIARWASSLTTLILFKLPYKEKFYLYNTLPTLEALESLYLIHSYDELDEHAIPDEILVRLRQLTIISHNKWDAELVLNRLGPKCTHLRVESRSWWIFGFQSKLSSPNLCAITHLACSIQSDILYSLCDKAKSLKWLKIEVCYFITTTNYNVEVPCFKASGKCFVHVPNCAAFPRV